MDMLLEVADVARLLNRTPSAVRALARAGRLRVAVTTPRGARLFNRADVEQLLAERSQSTRSSLVKSAR